MNFLSCMIAYSTVGYYLQGALNILIVFDMISSGNPNNLIGFSFMNMVFFPALLAGLLYGKIPNAPILKPAFMLSLMMFYGTQITVLVMKNGFDGSTITKAIYVAIGLIGIILTRALISYWFVKNPIQVSEDSV